MQLGVGSPDDPEEPDPLEPPQTIVAPSGRTLNSLTFQRRLDIHQIDRVGSPQRQKLWPPRRLSPPSRGPLGQTSPRSSPAPSPATSPRPQTAASRVLSTADIPAYVAKFVQFRNAASIPSHWAAINALSEALQNPWCDPPKAVQLRHDTLHSAALQALVRDLWALLPCVACARLQRRGFWMVYRRLLRQLCPDCRSPDCEALIRSEWRGAADGGGGRRLHAVLHGPPRAPQPVLRGPLH